MNPADFWDLEDTLIIFAQFINNATRLFSGSKDSFQVQHTALAFPPLFLQITMTGLKNTVQPMNFLA